MPESQDESFLRRAIRLAMNGRGFVEPNPMVGCVLVRDGRVIGEGIHERFGGPHAEPTALSSCIEGPRGATAYVTLEPCCHLNKKTPPCAPRLIEAGIARVVIGCLDPNPDVNGKGVAMLRNAGIDVVGPTLESAARQLISPFLLRTDHRRPYVTLKWAQTADGAVAMAGNRPMRITDQRSNRIVHELRARSDAITIGSETAIADDPLLTARDVPTSRPLLRYILDRRLRLPLESRVVKTARESPVIIATATAMAESGHARRFLDEGVTVLPADNVAAVLTDQYARGVTHSLIEPGPTLAASLLTTDVVDRVWIFRSDQRLHDDSAPLAPALPKTFVESASAQLGIIRLTEYLNTASAGFYAAEPSADFVMASAGAD